MSKRYSVAEAPENCTAMVNEAERGERVEPTLHGRPGAVLMSVAEYGRLAEGKGSFWESYESYLRQYPPSEASAIDIGDAFEGVRDTSTVRDFLFDEIEDWRE